MIVDAHNDLLLELVLSREEGKFGDLVLRHGDERLFDRYWLPQLEAGGVGIQICPLYAAEKKYERPRARVLAQEAEFRRALQENSDRVCQAQVRGDLDDPRLRLMLSMEGVEALEGDPAAFDDWWARGVRSASLTWNHPNEFAGGIETPDQGLTDLGARSSADSPSWASSSTWHTHPSRPGVTCSKRTCRSRSRTPRAVRY